MITNISPFAPSDRHVILDILRGFAIFGILMVNMQIFYRPTSMMLVGYTGSADTTGLVSEAFIKFFFEGKFYVLFSLLFGYGFWIFLNKKASDEQHIIPIFRRRLFILLLIGIAHVVLLWPGDILVYYALFGFLLLLFRKKSDRGLVKWAIWLALVPVILSVMMFLMFFLASMNPESKAAFESNVTERMGLLTAFISQAYEIYTNGSFFEIVSVRLREYQFLLPGIFFFYPVVLAMFLLGLWAARRDLLIRYRDHISFFQKSLWVSLVFGVPASSAYVYSYFTAEAGGADPVSFIATLTHTAGGFFMSLFYVSAIILLYHKGKLSIGRYLAPVGRMALTNYLLQSLICTTLFLSYGFGLFGQITVLQGILLSILIFGLQIPFSMWWLDRYTYGPAEWLWRSLTYLKWQPLKKPVPTIAV
jgi:uncharacterized protein